MSGSAGWNDSFESHITLTALRGSVAEWFKALVLKTSEGNTSVSSNLTASAILSKSPP